MIVTNETKQNHPITAKIHPYIWKNSFKGAVEERDLQFTQKPYEQLTREDLPQNGDKALILLLCSEIPLNFIRNSFEINTQNFFLAGIMTGRLDVLKELKKGMSKIEFLNIIKNNDYIAFCLPMGLGYHNIFAWFEEQLGDEFPDTIKKASSRFFCVASKFGQLDSLKWLQTQVPENFLSLISKNNEIAATYGHVPLLQWFKEQFPNKFSKFMNKKDYAGLYSAVKRNQMDVLNWYERQLPKSIIHKKIRAHDYSIIYGPIEEGHIAPLQWLIAQTSVDEFLDMIAARNYLAYAFAASKGHQHILQFLKDLAPHLFLTMVRAAGYAAFSCSAQSGAVSSLIWFKEQIPDEFLKMIKGYNYEAFAWAAQMGHKRVLQWLKENAPTEFLNMVMADEFVAFRNTAFNKAEIQSWLLEEPHCLAYAKQNPKYSEVVLNFTRKHLALPPDDSTTVSLSTDKADSVEPSIHEDHPTNANNLHTFFSPGQSNISHSAASSPSVTPRS